MKPNDKEIDAIYDRLLKMDKEVSRAEKERLRTRLRELEK